MSVPTQERAVLDCRGLPGEARAAALLEAFDPLRPGERLVAVTDAQPGPLLAQLRFDRKGLFEWSPLQEGPPVWRVEVTRREARRGAARSITEALSWDHDRLDALEKAAFEERASGRYTEAARLFGDFSHGLRRHIRFEEELLFPAFEGSTGFGPDAGPTTVMRAEHREILALLERIAEGIANASSSPEGARSLLHEVLGGHNVKEEQILYPGTDRALGEAESDELVARIQAMA